MNFESDAPKYIAEAFKHRLKELGITQYRLNKMYPNTTNRVTLYRILKGEKSTSISTIAYYADLLGLELRLVEKGYKPTTPQHIVDEKL